MLQLLQEAKTVEASESAVYYFPLSNGRYEVKPGLIPLAKDLGNGQVDKQVFQIDENFAHYREVKLAGRAERLSKYYQTSNYSHAVASAIAQLIINRLTQEYPQYFHIEYESKGNIKFYNQLTKETLYLDSSYQLQLVQPSQVIPPYASTLDALAGQIQSDITVISRTKNGNNWISA
ncbi:MAG: DUF3445 domain-containing protein, partial [Fischerella sp.]|nr:DUF3445 domain-containing protein [Fischerella sp.]